MGRTEVTGSVDGVKFIKAKALYDGNVTGVVLRGTYLESLVNKFNKDKSDYKFEDSDGNIVIINGSGNLGFLMQSVEPGAMLEIEYHGKQEMKTGTYKGTMAHTFKVFLADDEDAISA